MKTVEQRLADFLIQPGARVSNSELRFIADMRVAAREGVGYGFMQQVIEWEWQNTGVGAFGPEYFNKRIAALEKKVAELERDFEYDAHERRIIELYRANKAMILYFE